MASRYLIAIDDTDDIGTRGTGDIATDIANALAAKSGGAVSPVSRHQLYVHPDIPYTSHNSAMCFLFEGALTSKAIEAIAVAVLQAESAPAADPGLAFVCLDHFDNTESLMDFGTRAKREVLTKEQAYNLAAMLGVHLSEHGGTGQGVIGALAGLGLWLNGNDGRLKGHFDVGQGSDAKLMSVSALLSATGLDAVLAPDDVALAPDVDVCVSGKLKAVRRAGRGVIPVTFNEGQWTNLGKQALKDY